MVFRRKLVVTHVYGNRRAIVP